MAASHAHRGGQRTCYQLLERDSIVIRLGRRQCSLGIHAQLIPCHGRKVRAQSPTHPSIAPSCPRYRITATQPPPLRPHRFFHAIASIFHFARAESQCLPRRTRAAKFSGHTVKGRLCRHAPRSLGRRPISADSRACSIAPLRLGSR